MTGCSCLKNELSGMVWAPGERGCTRGTPTRISWPIAASQASCPGAGSTRDERRSGGGGRVAGGVGEGATVKKSGRVLVTKLRGCALCSPDELVANSRLPEPVLINAGLDYKGGCSETCEALLRAADGLWPTFGTSSRKSSPSL
jgi:hypothetical protein